MKPLSSRPSKKQAEILDFIENFQAKNKYSPSLEEIAKHFGISTPTVHQHISYLKMKKLLTSDKGKRRSLERVSAPGDGFTTIPLMGLIAAGGPIQAIRNPEPFQVPESMLSAGAKYYALRVSGRSMIEEGISDGDVVVIRDQQFVENGEKAVAYLPAQDSVTLKKIYRENGKVKLVPANLTIQPFYEDNIEIQGKVVGVLRSEP